MTEEEAKALGRASILHSATSMEIFEKRGGSEKDFNKRVNLWCLYADALEIPSHLQTAFMQEYIRIGMFGFSNKECLEASELCKVYNTIMTKAFKKLLRRNKRLLD